MDCRDIQFRVEVGSFDPTACELIGESTALSTVVDANIEFKGGEQKKSDGLTSPVRSFMLPITPLPPPVVEFVDLRTTQLLDQMESALERGGAPSGAPPRTGVAAVHGACTPVAPRRPAFAIGAPVTVAGDVGKGGVGDDRQRCASPGGASFSSGASDDGADTISTLSDVSGYEEELQRLRRLLSASVAANGGGVGVASEAHSKLRQRLAEARAEAAAAHKERATAAEAVAAARREAADLRTRLDAAEQAAVRRQEEAASAEAEAEQVRGAAQVAAVEAAAHEAAVAALRRKVVELAADAAESRVGAARAAAAAATERRRADASERHSAWCAEQLRQAIDQKARSAAEAGAAREAALAAGAAAESARAQAATAEAARREAQESACKDKQRLLRRLEQIEMEVTRLTAHDETPASFTVEERGQGDVGLQQAAVCGAVEPLAEELAEARAEAAKARTAAAKAEVTAAERAAALGEARREAAEAAAAQTAAEARAAAAEAKAAEVEAARAAAEEALRAERAEGAAARAAEAAAARERAEVSAAAAALRADVSAAARSHRALRDQLAAAEAKAREDRAAREAAEAAALRERERVQTIVAEAERLREKLRARRSRRRQPHEDMPPEEEPDREDGLRAIGSMLNGDAVLGGGAKERDRGSGDGADTPSDGGTPTHSLSYREPEHALPAASAEFLGDGALRAALEERQRRHERDVRTLLRAVKQHLRARRAAERALAATQLQQPRRNPVGSDDAQSAREAAPEVDASEPDADDDEERRSLRKQLLLERGETASVRRRAGAARAAAAAAARLAEARAAAAAEATAWAEVQAAAAAAAKEEAATARAERDDALRTVTAAQAEAAAARGSAEEAAAAAAAQTERARAAEARAAASEAAEMTARAALDALRAKRFAPPPPLDLPDLTSSLPPAPTALADAERLGALLQRCKTSGGNVSGGVGPHPLRHLRACVDSLKLEVKALHEQLQPQPPPPATTGGPQVI